MACSSSTTRTLALGPPVELVEYPPPVRLRDAEPAVRHRRLHPLLPGRLVEAALLLPKGRQGADDGGQGRSKVVGDGVEQGRVQPLRFDGRFGAPGFLGPLRALDGNGNLGRDGLQDAALVRREPVSSKPGLVATTRRRRLSVGRRPFSGSSTAAWRRNRSPMYRAGVYAMSSTVPAITRLTGALRGAIAMPARVTPATSLTATAAANRNLPMTILVALWARAKFTTFTTRRQGRQRPGPPTTAAWSQSSSCRRLPPHPTAYRSAGVPQAGTDGPAHLQKRPL